MIAAKAALKWKATLGKLLEGPQHRFDAERWGDHALHSTVSELLHDHGIAFDREWTKVPTRFGKTAHVRVYRVAPASRQRARELLGGGQGSEVTAAHG